MKRKEKERKDYASNESTMLLVRAFLKRPVVVCVAVEELGCCQQAIGNIIPAS